MRFENISASGIVDFLIDTGAAESILSIRDAKRIGLDPNNYPKGNPSQGVGGKADAYVIKERTYIIFLTSTPGVIFTASRKDIKILDSQVPSILGTRFLRELGLRLRFDAKNKVAFLEK